MVRIKICGVVRPEDARAAAAAGADAIGAVLHPPSPVAADIDAAAAVFAAAPPFVSTVAVVVNPGPEWLAEMIRRARPSLVQFHGDETPEFCAAFGAPYIKAARVGGAADVARALTEHGGARGILLDAKTPGKYGGGGKPFDWGVIPPSPPLPLIVAGGLTADLVGGLVGAHRPWGVDVSGGVAADGDKRRKDFAKMKAFVLEARNA